MIEDILRRKQPERIVYAPNYWQWFQHHLNHGTLPREIRHCRSQRDLIDYLGLAIFSRNIYSDQQRCIFGGLTKEFWRDREVRWEASARNNGDTLLCRTVPLPAEQLREQRRYCFAQSTIVQEEFLVKDYVCELPLLREFVAARHWEFDHLLWQSYQRAVGPSGVVIAGELHSPLKMLHKLLGPIAAVYLLADREKETVDILRMHEEAQLRLVRQIAEAGVGVMMSMDNLDTTFHPPHYVEKYSASFYERAACICHDRDALFMIHACGNQRANLKLISDLGVDGFEGVAYPPLGDVELEEAFELTHDRFIITGGITAMETRNLTTRDEVFAYTEDLFRRIRPYANRFVFSASCCTAIDARWETIVHFRDAWSRFGGLPAVVKKHAPRRPKMLELTSSEAEEVA